MHIPDKPADVARLIRAHQEELRSLRELNAEQAAKLEVRNAEVMRLTEEIAEVRRMAALTVNHEG